MAFSFQSSDQKNFECVTVASVDFIKLPLKDILESRIKPVNLSKEIKSCSTLISGKYKLRQDQLKLCFLQPPAIPDYSKFDVTLLYTLIRNLCPSLKPAKGWGTQPDDADIQIGDDIERLRLFRNNYHAHADSAAISDADFKDIWKNLKSVVNRIKNFNKGRNVDYEQELLKIESNKIAQDHLESCKLILQALMNIKKEMDDMADEAEIFIKGENKVMCEGTTHFEIDAKKTDLSRWSVHWEKKRGKITEHINTSKEKFSGSSNKNLVIQSVCKEDEGEYRAVVSKDLKGNENKQITLFSNTIRLHVVGELPLLNDLKVSTGDDGITIHYTYEILEQSPKVKHIEWSKNGNPMDYKSFVGGSLNDKCLTIISPAKESRGKYSCSVTNAVGSVSKEVILDVPHAEITVDRKVNFGSITTFKAEVLSTPPMEKVEWQKSKNGNDFHCIDITEEKYSGSKNVLIPESESAILVILRTTFDDMLLYRLMVWNKIGVNVSNTVELKVTGSPPNITTSEETNIKNKSVKLIGDVFLYNHSPDILEVFWTKNEQKIDYANDKRFSEVSIDDPSLTIRDVRHDDAGEYRLNATNAVGTTRSEVIVLGAPAIHLEKCENKENGGYYFTATIKAFPAPCSVQWSKEKKEVGCFTPIDVNAEEYKGTSNSLPLPVLVVSSKKHLEDNCFQVEVSNFVGSTKEIISGNQRPCVHETGTKFQAELVCNLNSAQGTQKILLNCCLHYLIQNLKKPNETWTKEKIVQHVRSMMYKLVESNEKDLLESFCQKISLDEGLCNTLLSCGEDFYALMFSIQEKYNARDILLSEGSFCMIFCFEDDVHLQKYVHKLVSKDEQLIKDLSGIILNKSLLSIFNIDPNVVSWTASTVKIYRGPKFLERIFASPIEGCSGKFITNKEDEVSLKDRAKRMTNKKHYSYFQKRRSLSLPNILHSDKLCFSHFHSSLLMQSHAQSCPHIRHQRKYGKFEGNYIYVSTDELESGLGTIESDSHSTEYTDSEFDNDTDDKDDGFHDCQLWDKPHIIPKEDIKTSTFEKSCKFHEKEKSAVLQLDILKYGLNLSLNEKRNKKQKRFYDDFEPPCRLEALLQSNSERYKRCEVSVQGEHMTRCTNMDEKDELKYIEISGRSRAGKVFVSDVVLVEILKKDERSLNEDSSLQRVYGKIIGIFERRKARDISHPVFVCTLDEPANNFMHPLCKTVPKLYIEQYSREKNSLQVYKYDKSSSNIEPNYEFRIDPEKRNGLIFLVVYLTWSSSVYPVGAVIEVINAEESFSSLMKVICLQHQMPQYYKKETIESTKKLMKNIATKRVLKEENREDFSHLRVFTIDPDGFWDLDCALSIEKVDENFRVGIHIADVCMVVKKDDQVDSEARERGRTNYAGEGINPFHMLPEPLSLDICSLLPGRLRPTISVIFLMTENGMILNSDVRKAVVKSCRKYTYDEVQKIIEKNNSESEIQRDILHLFHIAKSIRKRRPGTGFYFFPVETKITDDGESILSSKEAHYLVEEFKVLANTFVAQYLHKTFPAVIPLYCQSPPSINVLQKWKDNNFPFFHMVLRLQNIALLVGGKKDQVQLSSIRPLRYTRIMPVQKWVWENIIEALNVGNIGSAVQYICSDELHPYQCLALEEWISFQENSSYRCSGTLKKPGEGVHFSLQRLMYVHFTSPIKSYPDLIVHRLLHASLDKRMSPYSVLEIDLLCQTLNDKVQRGKQFQQECKMLTLGKRLKQQPWLLQGFVKEVSERSVTLVLPGLMPLPYRCMEIELNLLHLSKRPTFDKNSITGESILTLNWFRRVFDVSGKPNKDVLKAQRLHWLLEEAKKERHINPHIRTKFIQQERWKEIITNVLHDEHKELNNVISHRKGFSGLSNFTEKQGEDEYLHNFVPACQNTVLDHTSEVGDGELVRQACAFSMTISRGQVVCVQITAELQKGVLVPSLQMFNMTKNIEHCLQHNRDPIRFFSKYSMQRVEKKYQSSSDYLQIWLPIMEMETATNATREISSIVNGVHIFMESPDRGHFLLFHDFCEKRGISFNAMSPAFVIHGDEENMCETIENPGFLCIRSKHLTVTSNKHSEAFSEDPNHYFKLVLHGRICSVETITKTINLQKDSKEQRKKTLSETKYITTEMYKVNFMLHRESGKATPEMLSAVNGYNSCVELIQKPERERRIEEVLKCLDKSSNLAKSIALRKRAPDLDKTYMDKVRKIDIMGDLQDIEPNNVFHIEALSNSLRKSFSLIHGPPGTGKTILGVRLVYLFDWINNMLRADDNKHHQVIFCGPDDKSVDVVARYTKRKFKDLDIVRLYGNALENIDFPIPGEQFPTSAPPEKYRPDPDLKDISIHQIIRKGDSLNSIEINYLDCKFNLLQNDKSCKPIFKDIRRYKHIISEASEEELGKHHVIFCTIAETTSPRFIKGTHGKVFQLIIDKAGMCTEPESIAAIIATKAKQVVLIGDHKQLSPVICSTHAADVGLKVSLFESYAHLAKMLRFQYRMHPEICHFPSKYFYDSKLITKESKNWETKNKLEIWPNEQRPIVFCHVEGEEDHLNAFTEGNEQLYSNKEEVKQVLKVFEYLLKYENVNPSNKEAINIMSQYNEQCTRIRKALRDEKHIDMDVNTVVASQGGEWDYVIFSTTRSLPEYRIEKYPTLGWCKQNLGIITDEHQINIALTRARRGLIIIGNKNLLSCDRMWEHMLHHYRRIGCLTDSKHFPPPSPFSRATKTNFTPFEPSVRGDFFSRCTDPWTDSY